MSAVGGHGVFLAAYLEPFAAWLRREDVTDIFVNRPGEVFVETAGGALARHEAPGLDETTLWRLARQIAALTHQGISREHPLLSATLPGGARVQVVAPPATRSGVALAIRKHVVADLTLEHYAASGRFAATNAGQGEREAADARMARLLADGDVAGCLRAAVRARRSIVVCGGASSGKTTFLNALLKETPAHERLIVIEDAPEIRLEHPNAVGLIASRGDQGEARIGAEDLLQASLRMRPDRIILGELRGAEAFSFLRAVNSGHPGSMTTLHADSPRGGVEQLALMSLQAGAGLSRADITAYAEAVVDVWVQLSRQDGERRITDVTLRKVQQT